MGAEGIFADALTQYLPVRTPLRQLHECAGAKQNFDPCFPYFTLALFKVVWASIILPAQVSQSKGKEVDIPPKIHLVTAKPGGRAIPSLGSLKEHPGPTRILHKHKRRLVVRSTAWVEDRVQKADLGASRILESMDLEPGLRRV